MKPEEMSNEELLELAREVFDHCQREQTGVFVLEQQPDGSGCWVLFEPIGNPAHAWKVFKWLIGRYDRNDMDASDWTDGDETIEQVVLRRGVEEMRRIAVMRKIKEEK